VSLGQPDLVIVICWVKYAPEKPDGTVVRVRLDQQGLVPFQLLVVIVPLR